MELNSTHDTLLFKERSFVCLSETLNKVIISKVEKNDSFNPTQGNLLYDVDITKNEESGSINIKGKMFCIFKPSQNLLFSKISLITEEKIHELKDVEEDDIILKLGKFYIIKRKYYYFKTPRNINRCFFNTPITVLNCLK